MRAVQVYSDCVTLWNTKHLNWRESPTATSLSLPSSMFPDNGREVGRQMQMFSQRQSLPSYSSLLEKHDLKKTRNTARPFCHEHVEIEVSDHERGSDQTGQHIGQRQASDEKVQSWRPGSHRLLLFVIGEVENTQVAGKTNSGSDQNQCTDSQLDVDSSWCEDVLLVWRGCFGRRVSIHCTRRDCAGVQTGRRHVVEFVSWQSSTKSIVRLQRNLRLGTRER